jgi:uncharacterized protein YndB with AHSA1/START domain
MEKTIAPNNHEVGSIRIKQELTIDAKADKVFAALTKDTSFWWGAPYLIDDQLKALVVEPKLGGKFYEDWGDGGGAIWGIVTQWKQNEIFEFTGKCGMGGAVNGVICFTLESKGSSTLLKLEHDAVGHVTDKTQSGYSYGWNDLLEKRLKAYVEKGECHGIHKK